MKSTLDEIRARAAAARTGPWFWDGNVDTTHVNLSTVYGGHSHVMTFGRWGMQGAAPAFQVDGVMIPAKDMAVFDVAPEAISRDDPRVYRGDFSKITHPDAEFIAHSRQDVDDLLEYIERLENVATELMKDVMECCGPTTTLKEARESLMVTLRHWEEDGTT